MFYTDFIAICFQNMPHKGPFTPLLTVTGLIFSICLHVVISGPPIPVPARLLSEEFINYINSLHTTWKVSVQPRYFGLWSVKSHPTFRRNMSPQSSGSKNELQHRLSFNRLRGVMPQKIELFITTTVRISNPIRYPGLCAWQFYQSLKFFAWSNMLVACFINAFPVCTTCCLRSISSRSY
jgi:hypothetical protein